MAKLLFFLVVLLQMAPAQQNQTLAIVEKKAGKVAFYTSDGKRLSDVQVGSFPHELAFSPDRKLLYVTDNGLLWMTDPGEGVNSISILDLAKRSKVGVIDLGRYRRPHGMDVDSRTGRLVVTIENPFGILTVDPVARKVLRMYDVQGDNPHMVIYGPDYKTAWVSNSSSGTVAVVNLESGKVETLIPTGERAQGAVG
jgi:DNA-binding beta-propeller fold protein YncE